MLPLPRRAARGGLLAVFCLLALLIAGAQTSQAQSLALGEDLSTGTTSANEGYLTIEWQGGSPPYQLSQTSGTSTGEPIRLYTGEDTSYFMTGLLEGENQFAVEDSAGEIVELTVTVDYPSRALVYASLSTGAILLIALITIIVTGSRRHV